MLRRKPLKKRCLGGQVWGMVGCIEDVGETGVVKCSFLAEGKVMWKMAHGFLKHNILLKSFQVFFF